MHNILVVDDDTDITALLCGYLAGFGLRAHAAHDGASMRAQWAAHPMDLVVLDLMMPGEDGLTLARELRSRSDVPIIMLTARGSHYDRIIGLEMGADDYVTKPFEPRELVARIQSVLRRATRRHAGAFTPRHGSVDGQANGDVICFDQWTLHCRERRLASPEGLTIPLSMAEYRLLTTFLKTPRHVLSRDQLMTDARGRDMEAFERSIDQLVSRLRQKLADDPREPRMIKTVRGAGYLFNVRSIREQAAWAC